MNGSGHFNMIAQTSTSATSTSLCLLTLIKWVNTLMMGWMKWWSPVDSWLPMLFCRGQQSYWCYHWLTSLFHFDCLKKWTGYQVGNWCTERVRNVGQNKWCARWWNEWRRQEDGICRFIKSGWRLVSNTIEEWLISLNQQWPATAAEEVMASVLHFC